MAAHFLFVLLSLGALLHSCALATNIDGKLRVLSMHHGRGKPSSLEYNLETPQNLAYRLDVSKLPTVALAGLTSGADVKVTGTFKATTRGPPKISVTELRLLALPPLNNVPQFGPMDRRSVGSTGNGASAAATLPGTAPSEVKLLVIILEVCSTQKASATKQELEATLYGGGNWDLEGFYASCSYGKTSFSRATSTIVGPVSLPCSASSHGYDYTASTCSTGWDIYGLGYAALDAVQKDNLTDTSLYPHVALIMPTNTVCSFWAWGDIGCSPGTPCFSWYSSQAALDAPSFAHELGHNFNLHHASQGDEEYGDYSCIMGYSTVYRCYNAPHMWQLGWASPIANLGQARLAPGYTTTLTIPAAHTASTNMVRVAANWAAPGLEGTAFWINYRVLGGFKWDAYLNASYANLVQVYRYDGADKRASIFSYHMASLPRGGRWVDTVTMRTPLVIRVKSLTATAAVVTLCRKRSSKETACCDGLDNDCDGRTDAQDPDCANVRCPSPSPSGYAPGVANSPSPKRSPHTAPKKSPATVPVKLPSPKPSPNSQPASPKKPSSGSPPPKPASPSKQSSRSPSPKPSSPRPK